MQQIIRVKFFLDTIKLFFSFIYLKNSNLFHFQGKKINIFYDNWENGRGACSDVWENGRGACSDAWENGRGACSDVWKNVKITK